MDCDGYDTRFDGDICQACSPFGENDSGVCEGCGGPARNLLRDVCTVCMPFEA
jgi:hypothetical protein